MSKSPKITDIINFIENDFADIRQQSGWDFSGKQIFTNDRLVKKIALSLDVNKTIINTAIDMGCELLITHHPLFFREKKGIDSNRKQDELAIMAIKGGVDVLSYHTNLDIADDGTSYYICELLGAKVEGGYLSYEGSIQQLKLSVFVPYDNQKDVFDAMTSAGAGVGKQYCECGYMSEGVGMFTPIEGANPYIGEVGERVITDEVKLETVVDSKNISKVISAMIKSHPYEEPAYEIIKLENSKDYGFGKIAILDKPISLQSFITHLKSKLQISDIRTNMDSIPEFSKFAVCTGSAASSWQDCIKKGVNVLVTGDMKYHDAVDAMDAGVCIIDAGHQATEEIYMDRLAKVLQDKFDIEIIKEDRVKKIVYWEGGI